MVSPQGRVLSVHPDSKPPYVVVEVAAAPVCARCASGKGCGAGVLSGGGKARRVEAMLARGLEVREGDRVSIELAQESLLRAALLVYGLPLTGAVVASTAAYLFGVKDLPAVAMAMAGAGFGVAIGRLRLRTTLCLRNFTPTVTARLAGAHDQMDCVYVYSRQGCHLCEELIEELLPLISGKLTLEVRDIDTNREWHERFFMDIPVVEYADEIICKHFLDRDAITGILRR